MPRPERAWDGPGPGRPVAGVPRAPGRDVRRVPQAVPGDVQGQPAWPRAVRVGIADRSRLLRLPRGPCHLLRRGQAFDVAHDQGRPDVRQVPPIHRPAAGAERSRPWQHGTRRPGRQAAPRSGKRMRKPSCTDCHQGHDAARPEGSSFARSCPTGAAIATGNTRPRYGLSLHGQLTQLGYVRRRRVRRLPRGARHPADRQIRTRGWRVRTASRPAASAIVQAVANFARFDPHANHKDAQPLSALVRGLRGRPPRWSTCCSACGCCTPCSGSPGR